MSDTVFSSSEFSIWAAEIRQQESGDRYSEDKGSGAHIGAYQMGHQALVEAGFQDKNGDWTDLARSYGVNSKADFLNQTTAQDVAFENFTKKNYLYLQKYRNFVGKTIDAIYVTGAGLLAGAHLVGYHQVERFLSSDEKVIPADGGTPPVPVTRYFQKFGAPNSMYDKKTGTFVNGQRKSGKDLINAHQFGADMSLHKKFVAIGNIQTKSIAPVQQKIPAKKRLSPVRLHGGVSDHAETKGRAGSSNQVLDIKPLSSAMNIESGMTALIRKVMQGNVAANLAMHTYLGDLTSITQPSSISAHIEQQRQHKTDVAGIAEKQRMQRVAAVAKLTGGKAISPQMATGLTPVLREKLPSIAPIGSAGRAVNAASEQASTRGLNADVQPPPDAHQLPQFSATANIDPRQLSRALRELLDNQGRLPPSGATAFDPRLTPAWAGLKLPA
jgi:hypothetical protein